MPSTTPPPLPPPPPPPPPPPYTTYSSITRQNVNKAILTFSIDNFPEARKNKKTSEEICSESFSIGSSKFYLVVFPSGLSEEDQGFVSMCLINGSGHKVTVDIIMGIGNSERSYKSTVLKSENGRGIRKLIKISEVGQNMKVKADVTLVKEEVSGGLSLKREAESLQNIEQKFQKMEQNLVQKIEQKLENMMEQKLEQKLEDKLKDLKDKIHSEFDDLKEDINAPARAPECPICFEELRPPVQIVQCLRGHKLCQPCSQKPEIPCCPDGCKAGFIGRDFGMEAFILKQFQTRRQ